ncbi:energy transducer TonB [uncultured Tenacibaculum sp.]|uniref:energy transducer TonB n=1 Tax=uncultured Tenacibaculum sp. TaxID=174713 RepID=UPI002619DE63|nr:energy transducer TonB [uncultured Tenacibaculum sp.]
MKHTFIIVVILYSTSLFSQSQEANYATENEVKLPEIKSINEIKDVPFKIIEEVPVHPKCKRFKTNSEKKKCLNIMMIKHVQRHFNHKMISCLETKLVYDEATQKEELRCVSLKPGKKRIYVQFKIDITGKIIDIHVRAPHPKLEQEAIRVVKKLPKMKPGKQKGKPVRVGYTLPITFNVE